MCAHCVTTTTTTTLRDYEIEREREAELALLRLAKSLLGRKSDDKQAKQVGCSAVVGPTTTIT